jgi:hypothetical protein
MVYDFEAWHTHRDGAEKNRDSKAEEDYILRSSTCQTFLGGGADAQSAAELLRETTSVLTAADSETVISLCISNLHKQLPGRLRLQVIARILVHGSIHRHT